MKKILFVGYILFTTIACSAQIKTPKPTGAMTVIPVEKMSFFANSAEGIADDTYLKDVNHLLDKYIGTWKGATSTYKYEFRITQFTDYYNNLAEDKLAMRYIITDLNGTVIEDTTTLPNDSLYVIEGLRFITNKINNYLLIYVGKNAKCGQKGLIHISTSKNVPINPTQMKLNYVQKRIFLVFSKI